MSLLVHPLDVILVALAAPVPQPLRAAPALVQHLVLCVVFMTQAVMREWIYLAAPLEMLAGEVAAVVSGVVMARVGVARRVIVVPVIVAVVVVVEVVVIVAHVVTGL